MEHDERCAAQDIALSVLKEQVATDRSTQHQIVDRVQLLVNQMHDQRVATSALQADVRHVREKVDDLCDMEQRLETDYAPRSDFLEIKREWRAFLAVVLLSVAGVAGTAIVYFLRQGGTP